MSTLEAISTKQIQEILNDSTAQVQKYTITILSSDDPTCQKALWCDGDQFTSVPFTSGIEL